MTTSTRPAPRTVGGDRVAHVPEVSAVAERGGVRLAWAQYGSTGPDVVLMPTWSIVHSRIWKGQIPYLARRFRVTTFDGRGSGRSDRPRGAAAYTDDEYAADTLAVLEDAGVDGAVLVALSCGTSWALRVAARRPDLVQGIVAIAPSCGLGVAEPDRERYAFDGRHDTTRGWAKYNRHYWLAGPQEYDDFLRFFFGRMFHEPHSTKQIEDAVGWGHEVDPQTLVDTTAGRLGCDGATCSPLEEVCRQVSCPVMVMHGGEDAVRSPAVGERLAEITGGDLLLVEGAGHGLPSRHPVLVNREVRAFVERVGDGLEGPVRRTWTRALSRRRRALYLCSPIGLGHARRDIAVAGELRRMHPDLQVEWLAQDPVRRELTRRGEHVHPASTHLAGECTHIEAECGEHDLHAFQAVRTMDERLVANFMVFSDLIESRHYDVVVCDEAWEVDYFLHENPELKRAAYAWITDFVGWIPMPDGGAAESELTADYNAEMIDHRARFRGLRDRSIFVGDPEDVVDLPLGPGLPRIRDWTQDNFDFAGYVTGFEPLGDDERRAARAELGFGDDEPVCVVTVGGSAVGLPLLRRVADAVPVLRRRIPDLRVVLVTGPRIDPRAIPRRRDLQVHGYLPDLYRCLAACDVAVVQGGLTTCMELTANRRPFVYVPLRHHFEQTFHVPHRLGRYRAGRRLAYEDAADPDALADAVAAELLRDVDYRPVATTGAATTARMIAELL